MPHMTKAAHDADAKAEAVSMAQQFIDSASLDRVFSPDTIAAIHESLVTMMLTAYTRGQSAGVDLLDAALVKRT